MWDLYEAISRSSDEREKVIEEYFFFNDTATTEIYTLSLHDALPISVKVYSLSLYDAARTIIMLQWLRKRSVTDPGAGQIGRAHV